MSEVSEISSGVTAASDVLMSLNDATTAVSTLASGVARGDSFTARLGLEGSFGMLSRGCTVECGIGNGLCLAFGSSVLRRRLLS